MEPVQYAGLLLINWNSHVHGIVPEGVFTESGHFVHIPDFFMHRAEEFWHATQALAVRAGTGVFTAA